MSSKAEKQSALWMGAKPRRDWQLLSNVVKKSCNVFAHQKIFGIVEQSVASEMYEGTGIGLAIVARPMERMGGT